MGKGKIDIGVYIHITPELDNKLALIARLLPRDQQGKRWFKKDVIAKACELYANKFTELLNGVTNIDAMMAKAREIDPNAIEIDIRESGGLRASDSEPATVEANSNLPDEDAGLNEF